MLPWPQVSAEFTQIFIGPVASCSPWLQQGPQIPTWSQVLSFIIFNNYILFLTKNKFYNSELKVLIVNGQKHTLCYQKRALNILPQRAVRAPGLQFLILVANIGIHFNVGLNAQRIKTRKLRVDLLIKGVCKHTNNEIDQNFFVISNSFVTLIQGPT